MKRKIFYSLLFIFFHFAAYSQNDSLKGGELYSSNFLIDGIQRNFIYYMPANYGKKDAYPLVIFLHEQGGSGKKLINSYGNTIQTLADSSDEVIIYPDAVAGHWNEKIGESFPATDTVNDVGFISILIDYFKQVYSCDPKRVYVSGVLNGGNLAYRLSYDISNKITAIAPFVFDMHEVENKCNSNKSVAIMNTSGLMDSSNQKINSTAIEAMWEFFMSKVKE